MKNSFEKKIQKKMNVVENVYLRNYAETLYAELTRTLEPFSWELMCDNTFTHMKDKIIDILEREKNYNRLTDYHFDMYKDYDDHTVYFKIKIKPVKTTDWIIFNVDVISTKQIKRKNKKLPEEFVNLIVKLCDYSSIATKRNCDKVNNVIADIGEYLKNNGDYLIGKYLRVLAGKFYEDNNIERPS